MAIAPWKASSTRIELVSGGYFLGSMKYAQDRAAMTAPRLQALDGLLTRPNSGATGSGDLEVFSVVIVDADGSRATYVASETDFLGVTGLGGGTRADGTISKSTLDPFLATLTCRKAKAESNTVGADPGCFNGIFVSSDCGDVPLTLDIPSAGTYELASVACIETITIKVLSADGATVLASSPPGTKPSCSSVRYAFDAPGSYKVLLEKRNAAGCASMAPAMAGDFYLRVAPVP